MDGVADIRAAAEHERPPFSPERSALVVVDMIEWVPRQVVPGTIANQYFVDRIWTSVVPAHRRLISAFRAAGAPIAFARVGATRADAGDAIRPLRSIVRDAGAIDGHPSMEIVPELDPQPDDISVLKTGSGAFTPPTSTGDCRPAAWSTSSTPVY